MQIKAEETFAKTPCLQFQPFIRIHFLRFEFSSDIGGAYLSGTSLMSNFSVHERIYDSEKIYEKQGSHVGIL